jgi:16S rRNA (guanine1207-N2)-methyltransferase
VVSAQRTAQSGDILFRMQTSYHTLIAQTSLIRGRSFTVWTKPGVQGAETADVSGELLATYVERRPGARVVQFQCGAGLFGVVAAAVAQPASVVLTDRSVAACNAARKSMLGIEMSAVYACHGAALLPPESEADVVVFRIPTDKASLMQLFADAFALLVPGGRCCIAGATNEGIKSAATLLKAVFGNLTVLATESGHRVVSATKRSATHADPTALQAPFLGHDAFRSVGVTLRGERTVLSSRPGVFSWEHLDEATALLADTMQISDGESVLDLGCGAGALGIVAARLTPSGEVTMVDLDVEAVRSAERSSRDAGLHNVRVLASDVASAVREERFDVVVTNPPFHVGKATDLTVPRQFILDAWWVLQRGGRLMLVANRTLPYEGIVRELFGNCVALHDGPRFKVLGATRG